MKKRVAETSKFKKKIESEANRTATVNYFFKGILTKKKKLVFLYQTTPGCFVDFESAEYPVNQFVSLA